MYLLPWPIGMCNINFIWQDIFYSKLDLRSKINLFNSPKGYPYRDMLKFYKLSNVKFWLLQFLI